LKIVKVLDTNHLAELEENSAAGRILRTRLRNQTDPLATTIITVEEHLRGWLALLNRSNDYDWQIPVYARLQKQIDLFANWLILPFDQDAATLLRQFQKRRIRIGTMDLKIACIAITHNATLLTRNATLLTRNTVDSAQVPGLRF
jgi:tRNA(fMet)-specific endonuclease VapC